MEEYNELEGLLPIWPSSTNSFLKQNELPSVADPKKLKRIISNRVSAQKSRMKKLHYVSEMEAKVKALEAEIAVLQPQVLMFTTQQQLLQMEQKSLHHQLSARTNTKLLKDAEIEENKAQLNTLRELHLSQHQQFSWSQPQFSMNSNLCINETTAHHL
ncbi:basic leucine zipper 34 [Mercurialis annua]|uniref:basic leucine zipper 34 n=1 Tax=Mercurialis annua TaxID=3986 RepID=UPI0024ADD3DA|nr:basic leucine zipper 34 [Mercurialis annua]